MKQKPNLFIVGVPKAGTSALVSNLRKHSKIYVPNQKELRYFDKSIFYDYEEDYPIISEEQYLNNYSSSLSLNSKWKVDGSIFSCYDSQIIKNILSFNPSAKLVLVVRDPIKATLSMFKQRQKYYIKSMREVSDDFNECWELSKERRNGLNFPKDCRNKIVFSYQQLYSYENFVPSIIETVPRNQLLIISYKNLKERNQTVYSEIFDYLGIERETINIETVNTSYVIKHSALRAYVKNITIRTKDIRKRLGLTADKMTRLKSIVKPSPPDFHVDFNESYEDMKETYEKTYTYLNKLGINVDEG